MFREQNFLPDSIISIRRKIVFLSLKEKSASKASRCVVIIRKIFFPTRWIILNISRFQNILCVIVTLISESIKKRFTKCSDFSAVERKFPRNRRAYGKHWEFFRIFRRNFCKYFGETSARRCLLIDRCQKGNELKGYNKSWLRRVHVSVNSFRLFLGFISCLRVLFASRANGGQTFDRSEGLVRTRSGICARRTFALG